MNSRILLGTWIGVAALNPSTAAVLQYSQFVSQPGNSGGGFVNLPQFDPALGELESVTIRIEPTTSIQETVTGVNPGTVLDFLNASLNGSISVSASDVALLSNLTGFVSIALEAGSTSTGDLTAVGAGASQVLLAPLSPEWSGTGSRVLTWQVTGVVPSYSSQSSTGAVTSSSVSLAVTVLYTFNDSPLKWNATDGTFHYVEDGSVSTIEFTRTLVGGGDWSPYAVTGSQAVGAILRLPLEGSSGFYRLLTPSAGIPSGRN